MRPQSRILFGVLLALCWSGLASAEPPDPGPSSDSSVFRALTQIELDVVFERFVSGAWDPSLYSMAGPSSMSCTNTATQGGIETCVVTTHGRAASTPAALAQH